MYMNYILVSRLQFLLTLVHFAVPLRLRCSQEVLFCNPEEATVSYADIEDLSSPALNILWIGALHNAHELA